MQKLLSLTINTATNGPEKLESAYLEVRGLDTYEAVYGKTSRDCQCLSRKDLGFVSNFKWEETVSFLMELHYTKEENGTYVAIPLQFALVDGECKC